MSRVPKDTIKDWVGHTTTKMIDSTYGHLQREFQRDQMKKFSFYQPKNSGAPAENGATITGNPQFQEQSGSPEGAPEALLGKENANGK